MGIALNTLEKARQEIKEILDRIETGIWLAEGGDRETELKSCPFCGRKNSSVEYPQRGSHIATCRIECPCGAMGPKGRVGYEARELWNRRV